MENEVNNNEKNVIEQKATISNASIEKKENNAKDILSVSNSAYFLIAFSLFFVLLNKFIALLAPNNLVFALFFFLSFSLAFIAFIIAIYNKIKNKQEKIDLSIILSMFAIAITMF